MLNLRIPLFKWSLVGCTSLCMIPCAFKAAIADVSYLNMLSVWNRLIWVLQNCFQVLMWSGASDLKTMVLISLSISTLPHIFNKFGWFILETMSTNWQRICCLARGTGEKSMNVIWFSLFESSFHSIIISPSWLYEYKISGSLSPLSEIDINLEFIAL